jgi:signal transduction histidine kinase
MKKDAIAQIQQIARITVQEPDANELSARLAQHLALIFDADWAMVGLLRQEQLTSCKVHHNDPSRQDLSPDHEASLKWVILHKQTLHEKSEAGYALLVAPVLNHQDSLLAIMACQRSARVDGFSADDIEKIRTIALLLTSAFERAHLFDKMVEWNHSFEKLLKFNAVLNATVSSDVLLQRLVENAAGYLGAKAGFAALLDAGSMHSDHIWHNNHWQPFQRDWKVGSIPGWVRDNECPYLSNQYAADPIADRTLLETFSVHNAVCVPILNAQENTVGCICLHNKDTDFIWSDVIFLESLSNSTAIALENARLMKELEQQREQLKSLAVRNIDLLEDERQRIARELHDEAGQILIGIKLGLQVLHHKMPPEREDLRTEIDELRNHVNESTHQLKTIAQALRPPALDKLGLDAALRQLASEFERRCHIRVHYQSNTTLIRLASEIETTCYRIAQEAFTNVARHAHAEQIWMTLDCIPPTLSITIQDDGCGFEINARKATSLGLLGMQERAITVGGRLNIQSEPGNGTCLLVQIPTIYGEYDDRTIPYQSYFGG